MTVGLGKVVAELAPNADEVARTVAGLADDADGIATVADDVLGAVGGATSFSKEFPPEARGVLTSGSELGDALASRPLMQLDGRASAPGAIADELADTVTDVATSPQGTPPTVRGVLTSRGAVGDTVARPTIALDGRLSGSPATVFSTEGFLPAARGRFARGAAAETQARQMAEALGIPELMPPVTVHRPGTSVITVGDEAGRLTPHGPGAGLSDELRQTMTLDGRVPSGTTVADQLATGGRTIDVDQLTRTRIIELRPEVRAMLADLEPGDLASFAEQARRRPLVPLSDPAVDSLLRRGDGAVTAIDHGTPVNPG